MTTKELKVWMKRRNQKQDIPYVFKMKLTSKKRGKIAIPPYKIPLDLGSCVFKWELYPEKIEASPSSSQPEEDITSSYQEIIDALMDLGQRNLLHGASHKE